MGDSRMKDQLEIKLAMPRFFIRSITNNKEKAKQYFTVIEKDNNSDTTLIIRKLILSRDFVLYKSRGEFKIIKQVKGYYLFEQWFSIKMETLDLVMSFLNQNKIK